MKNPQTLSMKVLKRFYSEKQLADLMQEYRGARLRGSSGRDRTGSLDQPLTDLEKDALDHYFNHADVSMKDFANESKQQLSTCLSAVNRGTRKIIWQNLGTLSQGWK